MWLYFFFFSFFNLFWAALGLRCCTPAFSSCSEWGLVFAAVRGLPTAVASLAAEHGLQARRLQQLWHAGVIVVAHGLQSAGSAVVAHRPSRSSRHVGSSRTRARTRVPCIGRRILNHCTTREVLALLLIHLIYNDKNYQKFSYILKDVYFINHH